MIPLRGEIMLHSRNEWPIGRSSVDVTCCIDATQGTVFLGAGPALTLSPDFARFSGPKFRVSRS